jgi:hypothetical protein
VVERGVLVLLVLGVIGPDPTLCINVMYLLCYLYGERERERERERENLPG